MRAFLLCLLLAIPLAFTPAAASEEQATYVAYDPFSPITPPCAPGGRDPGRSLGMGGACFMIPEGASGYRVTIQDDVLGPGYGEVLFDDGDTCCWSDESVCEGVAEGMIPERMTTLYVRVADPFHPAIDCQLASLTWFPTRGTISIEFLAAEG